MARATKLLHMLVVPIEDSTGALPRSIMILPRDPCTSPQHARREQPHTHSRMLGLPSSRHLTRILPSLPVRCKPHTWSTHLHSSSSASSSASASACAAVLPLGFDAGSTSPSPGA